MLTFGLKTLQQRPAPRYRLPALREDVRGCAAYPGARDGLILPKDVVEDVQILRA
jgi:hypothetical protein